MATTTRECVESLNVWAQLCVDSKILLCYSREHFVDSFCHFRRPCSMNIVIDECRRDMEIPPLLQFRPTPPDMAVFNTRYHPARRSSGTKILKKVFRICFFVSHIQRQHPFGKSASA